MDSPKIEVVSLSSLQPDPDNANLGTERGYMMLTDSITERGLARGIFATKDGVVMAGNKTQQAAIDSGIDKAILVHTSGDALVVTVRDDLESSDPRAKKLAIEDNRIGQVGLEWDAEVLASLAEDDVNLEGLFTNDELVEVLIAFEPVDVSEQPRLDQKAKVTCPECGAEFVPK